MVYFYGDCTSVPSGKYDIAFFRVFSFHNAHTSSWGDVLKIEEVKTYWKVSDRPFYDEMNDDEKIEICKYSEDIGLPYEFIKFSKSTV